MTPIEVTDGELAEHFRLFAADWLKQPLNSDTVHELNGREICCPQLVTAADALELTQSQSTRIAELESEIEKLREALGAHLIADGYRDEFPDDEDDAKYLRKSETYWRLSARKWTDDELAYSCALVARKRGVAEDTNLQAILEKIDGELVHVNTPMPKALTQGEK